ncbi:hypothetical protein [Naumannella halotolerans]|nr:hypothetical protein [Naumannella halotolerans]
MDPQNFNRAGKSRRWNQMSRAERTAFYKRASVNPELRALHPEAFPFSDTVGATKAAEIAGVSRKTIWQWCNQGRFDGALRTEDGDWRIPITEARRLGSGRPSRKQAPSKAQPRRIISEVWAPRHGITGDIRQQLLDRHQDALAAMWPGCSVLRTGAALSVATLNSLQATVDEMRVDIADNPDLDRPPPNEPRTKRLGDLLSEWEEMIVEWSRLRSLVAADIYRRYGEYPGISNKGCRSKSGRFDAPWLVSDFDRTLEEPSVPSMSSDTSRHEDWHTTLLILCSPFTVLADPAKAVGIFLDYESDVICDDAANNAL